MEKTAMQELYEYLCGQRDIAQKLGHKSISEHYHGLAEIVNGRYADKERQQIEDAYRAGVKVGPDYEDYEPNYYDQTYGK